MKTIYQSLCFERNNHFNGFSLKHLSQKLHKIALLCFVISINSAVIADEVLVAVASNFIKPMQAISKQFTETTGHEVRLSFGSSGKLMAQIKHGAPFDLFLSADKDKVIHLLDNGLAIKGSEFIYAQGRLVLWSTKQDFIDKSGNILNSDNFRHIALADAKLAPYGRAAEQVIKTLNINEQIMEKMVRGESISQTYQFVRTGNAELGFVALSQMQQHSDALKGSTWLIPDSYHQAIEQYAVTLSRAESNPAATALSHFLQQESTLTLIRSFGYDLPESQLPSLPIKPKSYADLR